MTFHKRGRSTDYAGTETPQRYAIPGRENPEEIVQQFERFAAGLSPISTGGDKVAWVRDDTMTDEDRAFARETARILRREVQIDQNARPREKVQFRRTASQVEAEIAAVLVLSPDATAHDIRIATGIEHSRILRSQSWLAAHAGKKEESK